MLAPVPRNQAAVTVVARNYLPHARVLAASLRDHHPDTPLWVLVVDDDPGPPGAPAERPDEPFQLLTMHALGVDDRELHRRAMIYEAQGLISSLRPLAVMHLLEQGAEAVLLLDADMRLLAPIGDVWELVREAGVLLSPHVLAPLGGAPGAWAEEELLLAGTFNGGFLGAGPGSDRFLRWIDERVRRDAVADRDRGLFYAQGWFDLVPALFDHAVLRDPGVNFSVHRLGGRDLEGSAADAALAGAPVRLVHFTGFSPDAPDRLCGYYGDERAALLGRPRIAALCAAYAGALRDAGWPTDAPYPWGRLPDGAVIDPVMRAVYREALACAERGQAGEPPDPFDARAPAEFVRWLASRPPARVRTEARSRATSCTCTPRARTCAARSRACRAPTPSAWRTGRRPRHEPRARRRAGRAPGDGDVRRGADRPRRRAARSRGGGLLREPRPRPGGHRAARPPGGLGGRPARARRRRAVSAITTTARDGYVEQVRALGVRFGRLVHPSAVIARSTTLAEGVVVQAGVVIGARTRVGAHVMINRGALIGHHVVLEDFVTIQPGAILGGASHVEARAYVALGAHVLDRRRIGAGAVIGAGALVTRDVGAHTQVVGAPARVTRRAVTGL